MRRPDSPTDLSALSRKIYSDFAGACRSLYWINPRAGSADDAEETDLDLDVDDLEEPTDIEEAPVHDGPAGTEGLKRLLLWPEQVQSMRILRAQRRAGKPGRLVKVKPRQSGDSTFGEAWNFHHTYWQPRQRALTVAHHDKTTNALYTMTKTFYRELPAELRWPEEKNNRKELSFRAPSGSSIAAQTAGFLDIGHGLTLNHVHLCLRGDTEIILADGNCVPIEDVEPDDEVRTHTGARARVRAVLQRPATDVQSDGAIIKIRPWLSYEMIKATPGHKVLTSRGWIPAGEVCTTDEIAFPIRPLTETHTTLACVYRTPIRPQGGGSQARPADLPLNRETGFFVGYYLAEGCLKKRLNDRVASAIILTSHEAEISYAKRAIAAVEGAISSVVTRQQNTKAIHTWVFSVSLAETMRAEFGELDDKRLPEWVFDAPREFLVGVLLGYVCGDGSKGLRKQRMASGNYQRDPAVRITSIRLRLLLQLRSIVAALGWGWASLWPVVKVATFDKRGWFCRQSWVLGILGDAAIQLRRELDWECPTRDASRVRAATRYRIENGVVWVRVKEILYGHADVVYDLEVDHPDHSFETAGGIVANSEIDLWVDPDTALEGIMETTPEVPGTTIIIESKAQGHRWLHQFWKESKQGKTGFYPQFTAWFQVPEFHRPLPAGFERTKEEEEWAREFHISDTQIYWYRRKRDQMVAKEPAGGLRRMKSSYPFTDEEAFQSSGQCVFPDQVLHSQRAFTEAIGGTEFIRLVPMPGGTFTEVPTDEVEADLVVYEKPDPSAVYSIGMDIGEGVGQSESVVSVCRYPGYVQAAEWANDRVAPDQVAFTAAHIAQRYGGGNCVIIPEINKSGILVAYILNQLMGDYAVFLHRYLDRPGGKLTDKVGWDCVTPDARVLMADLEWRRADAIEVGAEVLGCEEYPAPHRKRRLRLQEVVARTSFTASTLEVVLAGGQTTRVSVTHPFLAMGPSRNRYRWIEARHLQPGDRVKCLPVWAPLETYDAGRLSAFLDGEGHLSRGQRSGLALLVSQSEGLLADEIEVLWPRLGFLAHVKRLQHRARPHEKPIQTSGLTRFPEVLRARGVLRPTRLLRKFRALLVSERSWGVQSFATVPVAAVRSLGEGEVIGLETAPDHTLIADGIVGHNTTHQSKGFLVSVANMVFLRGLARQAAGGAPEGVIRSSTLLQQMTTCLDVLPGRRWESEGKSDRIIAWLIAMMGAYLEYDGGSVGGIVSASAARGEGPRVVTDPTFRWPGTFDSADDVFEGRMPAGMGVPHMVEDFED